MLYHFPIESYTERYTAQLCGKGNDGWLESRLIENNIPFKRISPTEEIKKVEKGMVLDAVGRSVYCFDQLKIILEKINNNEITNKDVFYFSDFWTPGIEALSYAFHLLGIKPKMYSFCHAQSVDQNDFTFEMLPWIRHFEKGNGSIYDGVFVNSYALKNLLVKQGVVDTHKVYVCGHVYNEDKVIELFPTQPKVFEKKNQIVFSSRWDKEKNPLFFLKLAERAFSDYSDLKFIVTTSFDEIKSNDPMLIEELKKYPYPNLEIREGQTKTQYYQTLLESKFQFNCADQDFISYCLLEAITCDCIPIYPDYLSFPEVLPEEYLYEKGDILSAENLIWNFTNKKFDPKLKMIIKYHNNTCKRIINIMEVTNVQDRYSN